MAGEYDYSFTFAGKNIQAGGDWNIFILRYNQDGNMSGSSQITGSGFKKVISLGIDKPGNVYLLGYFLQQAVIGDLKPATAGPRGSGFLAKMKSFPER